MPRIVPVFNAPSDVATISWQYINGVNWALENANNLSTITDVYPGGEATLDWVQAKLLFYAATAQTGRYQIDVVQVKDTRLTPDPSNNGNQMNAAFWQAAMKKFAYNPLESGDSKYNRYFKFLHSQTFIMDPKETSEPEANHMREINIFLRLNRACRYDWEDQDLMNVNTVSEGQVNLDSNIKNTVQPRARIFLMIRATSKFNTTGFTSADNPSYDVVLRSKFTQLAS